MNQHPHPDEAILDDLLILCPSHGAKEPQTDLCLREMQAAGARLVWTVGVSDVALHRCMIAGIARDVLATDNRRDWIMWFDSDMVGSVVDVESLIQYCAAVGMNSNRERSAWPAITGRYVQRTKRDTIAARELETQQPWRLEGGEAGGEAANLPPVYSGMGCLVQTSDAFLAHCEEATEVAHHDTTIPCVTASGPVRNPEGEVIWGSEDFSYCAWEWQRERGVYLAPVHFGHVCRIVVFPTGEAELPGPTD